MAFRALILGLISTATVLQLAGAGAATPEKERMNLNGLVTNSPFGSAKSGAMAGANGNEPLEFRSELEESNSKFFSIYDTNTHRSVWVELNDPVNGFSVKSYDAVKESITVDYQGKLMTLPIKKAPAATQVFQPPQPVPQPGPNGVVPQPPAGQPGQVQMQPAVPSAIDQQRIQQIQEEIRRRRALRSQIVPTITPGMVQPSNSSGPAPRSSGSNGSQPYPQRN